MICWRRRRRRRRRRTAGIAPGVVWPWLVVCCYLAGAVAVTARLWVDPAGRAQVGDSNDVDLFVWFVRYAATAVGHGQLPRCDVRDECAAGRQLDVEHVVLLPGVLLGRGRCWPARR